MWKNYLKSAWRNLLRNKLYTSINLVGFSLALAAVFILLVYVSNEYSYDKDIPNHQQLYRLVISDPTETFHSSNTSYPMKEAMVQHFPEVEDATSFFTLNGIKLKSNDEFIPQNSVRAINNNFFGLMGVKILEGNPVQPLSDAYSVVLSQKLARKHFGKTSAVGKKIVLKNKNFTRELTVSAVMADIPFNRTYRGECFIHMDLGVDIMFRNLLWYGTEPKRTDITENWWFLSMATIARLQPGTNPDDLSQKLAEHFSNYSGNKIKYRVSLQNLAEAHLNSDHLDQNVLTKGNRKLIFLLLTLAFLIVVVASVNYVILNTATSLKRTHEVGIRKVIGAERSTLRFQLLIESVLLSLICLPIALTLSELVAPHFQSLFGISIEIHYGINSWLFLCFSLITIMAGVSSGIYMAVFLTRIQPIEMLKAKSINQSSHTFIRKTLILVQLIIFTALITSSLLIQQQLHYLSVKELGYDKDCIILVPLEGTEMESEYQWMKDQLKRSPLVIRVSGTMYCPPTLSTMYMTIPQPNNPEEKIKLDLIQVDEDFIDVMGMKMIAGRSFSSDQPGTKDGIILNERAVKEMKLDQPIETKTALGPVVGVVKDFHMKGLTQAIGATGITLIAKKDLESKVREIVVRTKPENMNKTMELIRSTWKQKAESSDLTIRLMDDKLNHLFQKERTFNKLLQAFTLLAILIAALGLFGFSLFMVEQRTQEIGIRKVMGASIGTIIREFCREYVRLIMIGFFIAAPLSWYFMHRILENYAYKAPISPWYFAAALLATAGIVLISIISNIWKAANQNPVESLKYE